MRAASKLLSNTMFSYRGMGLSMVGDMAFVDVAIQGSAVPGRVEPGGTCSTWAWACPWCVGCSAWLRLWMG